MAYKANEPRSHGFSSLYLLMGFAISWFAVSQAHAADLLQSLQLKPTGESEDFPESPIAYARLPKGWTILLYHRYDCPFLGEHELAALSARFDIIRCQVEEHVMASSVELWSGGLQVWSIAHLGEDGPKGLDISGSPPASLPAIRAEMETEQAAEGGDDAEVDFIFEIPLRVAQDITGFKHDEEIRDVRFEVLERASVPPGSGFLSRLFGRGKT